jgi:ADP-ribose pyrophosphatase YjhB (NUDIX family)
MSEIELRVAAALVRGGQILLVRHEKAGRSYWVLPGGHVKWGETLSAALVRELSEELHLDAKPGALLLVHDFVTPDRHVLNLVFRVEVASDAFRVTLESVLREARFFEWDELSRIEFLPPIARQLRHALENPAPGPVYLGTV